MTVEAWTRAVLDASTPEQRETVLAQVPNAEAARVRQCVAQHYCARAQATHRLWALNDAPPSVRDLALRLLCK